MLTQNDQYFTVRYCNGTLAVVRGRSELRFAYSSTHSGQSRTYSGWLSDRDFANSRSTYTEDFVVEIIMRNKPEPKIVEWTHEDRNIVELSWILRVLGSEGSQDKCEHVSYTIQLYEGHNCGRAAQLRCRAVDSAPASGGALAVDGTEDAASALATVLESRLAEQEIRIAVARTLAARLRRHGGSPLIDEAVKVIKSLMSSEELAVHEARATAELSQVAELVAQIRDGRTGCQRVHQVCPTSDCACKTGGVILPCFYCGGPSDSTWRIRNEDVVNRYWCFRCIRYLNAERSARGPPCPREEYIKRHGAPPVLKATMTPEEMLAFNTITPEEMVVASRMNAEVVANGGIIPPHFTQIVSEGGRYTS